MILSGLFAAAAPAQAVTSVRVESQITAHNLPYLDSPYVSSSTLAAGTLAPVECQAQGRESIGGTPVWYRVNHVYYPAYAFAGAATHPPCGTAHTVPAAANGYTAPSFSSTPREGWFVTGDSVKALCTAAGQEVNGNNAWFFVRGYWLHSTRLSGTPSGIGYATCWGYLPPRIGKAIARAESQIGLRYSWGGGNQNGPSYGICCSPSGRDGRNVYGFDCSGLTQYAIYQGSGILIASTSVPQYQEGYKVPLAQRKAGDLVFWSNSSETVSGIHHVALLSATNTIIEATPEYVRKRNFSTGETGVMPYVVRPIR
jgi:hypothetical protein